ncbi:hypothetical protein MTR67_001292 [Solanum verrucosum]|uniref:Chromo domain-containing protein n=1 Tax=Solanum verrucosum TaxID=315347 RepID=A0AAF0PP18_SOLVR|nr:hypothetical protein MTR67_001292 [Solanum verrucosum]
MEKDLSNAAEFARFRVRMSELCPLEVGMLAHGSLVRICKVRVRTFERREKEEEKEKKKQGFVKIVVVFIGAKRIGNVAYELELPQELAAVHPVFHISMLKKCISDPSLILPTKSIRIKDILSNEEIPVQILDRQVRRLRTKDVASVKVLWRNQFVEEATWEAEEDMKKRYPYLFESGGNAD